MSGPGTTNANGVGSFTATCSGAKDNADNSQAAGVSLLGDRRPGRTQRHPAADQPDGTSLFNRGKAVPVKFRLAGDEPTDSSTSGWTLQRIKVSCTDFDSEDAALEAAAEYPSNAFRYDAGADQYINNASFKDQLAGTCWKVRVTLDEPPDHGVCSLQAPEVGWSKSARGAAAKAGAPFRVDNPRVT